MAHRQKCSAVSDFMESPVIATIVEGHGEVSAILTLINNIITSSGGFVYPRIVPPYRVPWGSLVNRAGELERYSQIALQEGGPDSRLLVLLDADDRCPASLGPDLLERLVRRFPQRIVSVNVADWEYESWFIASAESIALHVGISLEVEVPENIEEIENPKAWIERNILHGRYRETSAQASFSSAIDVALARQRSHSFNRFCREVERLLA